jgi:quercetin 2,3-dioxygenase
VPDHTLWSFADGAAIMGGMNADSVLQQFPLGAQWPTLDPFLFCAHHLDHYPAGNADMGPAGPLGDREIGADFSGIDGWSMYHGATVPGFPQHPHRGFETITYVRRGVLDHSDSLGASARFGAGDAQWLTAGSGIVHSEMFPLVNHDSPNPLELFQIWLNLPAAEKMVDPYFTMCWSEHQRRVSVADGHGVVAVVAGAYGDAVGPPPPPNSWAARPGAEVAVWHAILHDGAMWTLPPARHDETARVVYFFDGAAVDIDGRTLKAATGALVASDRPVTITADGPAELLVLQGRPIGEPVAQYGPFVMNSREEIEQAVRDYQRTGFGGWPWDSDAPVHARPQDRFALRPDGVRELPGLG